MNPNLVVVFGTVLAIVLGLPIVVALARRIAASGNATHIAALPQDLSDRLQRIEQMMEATQIEVERISEGQRFTTKLLADRATIPKP